MLARGEPLFPQSAPHRHAACRVNSLAAAPPATGGDLNNFTSFLGGWGVGEGHRGANGRIRSDVIAGEKIKQSGALGSTD